MKILMVFAWLYPSYAQMNVAAAVVGGAMSYSASKSAANSQAAAAAQADATQRYQFDETNRLNAPFRETGLAANNRLAHLLGIGRDTSVSTSGMSYEQMLAMADADHRQKYGVGIDDIDQNVANAWKDQMRSAASSGIDQNSIGGQWGSLLRNYGQSDAENDYIYQTQKQFGLDEGVKGINRMAAASGGIMNGAVAKALTRFGNDYAGTKLGESYNRFENNKNSTYNKLAGVSGAGQQATNQINAAGQNMANNISSNQIGLGNARGASAIAGANSFNNALSSGVNAYQQNQLMKSYANNSAFDQSNGYNSEMARLNGSF